MFPVAQGEVIAILRESPDLQELQVSIPGKSGPERAYNYQWLYRKVSVGEKVYLNTIALKLGLGTGGRHFVIPDPAELAGINPDATDSPGHIMKLRYTPWQFPVLAAEEEASPYHETLMTAASLEGVPVVVAPLHSMLPGIILGFLNSWRSETNPPVTPPQITYIMTDGAALPMALSDLVRELKQKKLLDLTITTGHAYGGDLECVSIPSALLAAKQVGRANLIIVALGPGIVGTGTTYGFSSIDQSWVVDVTTRLNGFPVVVPRISEADPRERHLGISHHTLTILDLANLPANVAISRQFSGQLKSKILAQLKERNLLDCHFICETDDPPVQELFRDHQITVKSMGRGVNEDPAFFQATVAAGNLAAKGLLGKMNGLTRLTR